MAAGEDQDINDHEHCQDARAGCKHQPQPERQGDPPLISPIRREYLRAAIANTSWITPRINAHQPMIRTTMIAVLLGQIIATRPVAIETIPRPSNHGFLVPLLEANHRPRLSAPSSSVKSPKIKTTVATVISDHTRMTREKPRQEHRGGSTTTRSVLPGQSQSFLQALAFLVFGASGASSVFQSMTGGRPRVASVPDESLFCMAKLVLCSPK